MTQSNLPNGNTTFPDYSGIGVMSEEDQRFYREITENTIESKRKRIDMIRNSGKDIIGQIKYLSYDPYSKRDIVAYILKNGPFVIHFLKPSTLLDEQGNDFIDFVESDENLYFQEIIALLEKLNAPQYANVVNEHEGDLQAVKRAAEMWEALLQMREEAGELLNCGDEDPGTVFIDDDAGLEECVSAYNMVKDFIMSCAKWELGKVGSQGELVKQHVKDAVRKYVSEQKELLHGYFTTYMRDADKLIPLVDWDGFAAPQATPSRGASASGNSSAAPQTTPSRSAPATKPSCNASKKNEFEIENGVLKKYNGSASYVVVPEGVREISCMAFDGCKLKGLEIPDTVRSICLGQYSSGGLEGCKDLKTLKISGESAQGVMGIGEFTFLVCTNLESVTLPQGFRGKERKIFGPLKKYIRFTYTSSNVKCKVHTHHLFDIFRQSSVDRLAYGTNKSIIKAGITAAMQIRRVNAQLERRYKR